MDLEKQWVAGGQIQGGREYQDDSFAISFLPPHEDPAGKGGLILLLADGMGGYAGGAEASETVIKVFLESFSMSAAGLADRFNAAVESANLAVREKQEADPALAEMGTTLIAAVVIGSTLYWISIGDSPLWLFRDGHLHRLNADHSMRPLLLGLVELGRMTEEEVAQDPRLHQLRSAIFGEDIELVDMNADGYVLKDDDLILLASDGLETLSDEALAESIYRGGSDAQEIVQTLLDDVSAADKPGQDNATVIAHLFVRGTVPLRDELPVTEPPCQMAEPEQENKFGRTDEKQTDREEKSTGRFRRVFTTLMNTLSGQRGTDGHGG